MATTIAIKLIPDLKEPQWPKTDAKVGEELELAATPVNVTTQTACFEIRNKVGNIVTLLDVDSTCKTKWKPPATPEDEEYSFHALLRDKPTAANGYLGVIARTEAINKLTVKGIRITDLEIDDCFVPKLEKLVAKFKIAGELPAKGRIEIWGERYPTSKPLYFVAFEPKAENKWTWDGKRNDAVDLAMVGDYISPQFSPYRLRIIVGPDDDAVKEPYQKGLGNAALIDNQFEIVIQKVQIRVQSDYADSGDAKYHLRKALAIEKTPGTPQPDGTFKAMGRLPKEDESGRIRIPLVTHWGTGQLFDQGVNGNEDDGSNLQVSDNYVTTCTKYTIDSTLHTRPEIPLEFEVRLRSRKYKAAPDSERNKAGRFEPEALGPLRLEPFAEDYPSPVERAHGETHELEDLYSGGTINDTYFKNSLQKIKQANHNAANPTGTPVHSANQPVFAYWQARFAVAADGQTAFDMTSRDPGFSYAIGGSELTVYLNRTLLSEGTNDELDKKRKDYKEESTTAIKLRPGLTKKGDIIWVVRNVTAPVAGHAIPRWNNYPPGTNSHEFYGGIRAAKPNNIFLADYSPDPGGTREPIIGKSITVFPYKDGKHIELSPDASLPAAQRERVEVQALVSGAKKGLAGILFSPSYIGGDCYRLRAVIEQEAYFRSFGCVASKPSVETKTGSLSVWRVCHIHQSVRLADVQKVGLRGVLANSAGENIFDSPPDPEYTTRAHPGDGINMSLSVINSNFFSAFNEWTIRPPVPVINATSATPIRITAPDHGLTDGESIKIIGVPGESDANGVFVVGNVAGKNFTLHSRYDFSTASGAGAGVAGGGFVKVFGGFLSGIGKPLPPTRMPDAVNVANHPTLTVTAASTTAPVKITTGAAHGLSTGHQVIVKNVTGNLDANGIFKVTIVSPTEVTLDDSDGADADAFAAGGTLRRINVSNEAPITITCAAAHGLSSGDSVYLNGVLGNTAANGLFKVTVVDATNLKLNDSDGSYSGEYVSGGTVQQCGIIDVHRGVNLKRYKTVYDSIGGLGAGKLTLNGPVDIQKQFAPYDVYREFLPPGLPVGYQKVASNAIHALPKGRTSHEAMAAVKKAIETHVAKLNQNYAGPAYSGSDDFGSVANYRKLVQAALDSGAGTFGAVYAWIKSYIEDATRDATLTGGALLVPIYTAGNASHYATWASGRGTTVANALLAAITPPLPNSAQPKSMPVMRWPEYFQHGVWIDAKTNNSGVPDFRKSSIITLGFCSPKGWSMFEAQTHAATVSTFTHEMGHGLHLSHFVVNGNDFNWKQHHLLSGNCLMSYGHTSGYIPQPAGAVGPTGAGAAPDTGWPHTVLPEQPAAPPPAPPYRPGNYLSMDTTVAVGDPTIAFVAPTAVGAACAKCILKLRGWNEEKLPSAWKHPDLY